jgi:D-threo-aldose 1-dehydrogenase
MIPSVPVSQAGSIRLGFGCSLLMAALGRRESLRLLGAAFDCGIRHFDVARSYGYGEAEAVLGEFAKARRDEITITTKVGILPPPRYLSAAPVKQMARTIVKGIPLLRPFMRRAAGRMTRPSRFDVGSTRRSFEQSLRKLKSTYVDVLLLHDCTADEANDPALQQFLEDCTRTGSVRRHGIASTGVTIRTVAAGGRRDLAVAQFADSIGENRAVFGALNPGTFPVTHSIVAADLERITGLFNINGSLASDWSNAFNVDVRNREKLGALLIAAALRRNSGGCVLYSSRNVARLQDTVGAIARGEFSPAQCATFESLVMKARAVSESPALAGAA